MPIKNGSKVKVSYKGTLDDGIVFDSSDNHGPLEFEVGSHQVIPGFEKAVLEMEKNEEKTFRLSPSEAYGEYDPRLTKEFPRNQLPKEELKPGMVIMIQLSNGAKLPARIAKITEELVTLDFNHPLAGKALTFKIKIVEYS